MDNELVPQQATGCQAKTDAGNVCGDPVYGPGIPFCINHYRGVTTGRRSKEYEQHLPSELRDKFERQLADPSPTDLSADIARLRAGSILLDELLSQKVYQAKMSGIPIKAEEFESWTAKTIQISESLRRLSESQARLFPARVVGLGRIKEIIGNLMMIIRKEVKEDETRKRIMDGFQQIAIALEQGASELIPGGSDKLNE